MQTYSVQLVSKKEIARDILEIRLTKPEGFVFLAGQFIQVHAPDLTAPEALKSTAFVKRAYSISSTPYDPYIELCVKVLPGGKASGYLNALKPGSEVVFEGPFGHCVCEAGENPLLFIATGTGLAPLISILEDEFVVKKSSRQAHLLFGVRSEEDLFWVDRLEKIKKIAPSFSYSVILSQPSALWQGAQGRVTSHAHRELTHSRLTYVCGSLQMVKDVRALLVEQGVEQRAIRVEIF